MLFPDEMDMSRGLSDGAKLNRCFGRSRLDEGDSGERTPGVVPACVLRGAHEDDARLQDRETQPISIAKKNKPLYRLIFGSRSALGIKIWNSVCSHRPDEQDELPIFDV
jgi:hypothetical protein